MQLPEQPLELIRDLNRSYELELAEHLSLDQLEALLAEKLSNLIRDDFNALVQWLYRVDVNEARLKRMLSENSGVDAGRTIARLVMERQWQKMETRRKYRPDPPNGDPEW